MKKILIIQANPRSKSFCSALADSYELGARKAGATIRRLDLHELKFDPILWDAYESPQKLEPDLVKAQEDILWAEHIVITYPVWWATMPALLKGFIDRVFLPGFAFEFRKKSALWNKLLKGRSAHIIVTMGAPYLVYTTLFGKASHKAMINGVLKFCGISPVRTTTISHIEEITAEERNSYINEVEQKGEDFY